MNPKIYQRLQIGLFLLIVFFGVALLCGLKLPAQNTPEALWLGKIWEILLVVLNVSAFAAAIAKATKGPEETKE